jgi:hypothetical protein
MALMIGGLAAMLLAAILFPYAKKKRESRASSTRKGLRFKRY